MAYRIITNKKDCYEQLKELVTAFKREYSVYKTNKYSEAQLRIDFINPFLKSFGWDVDNENKKSQFLRDVIQEESINIKEDDSITKRNPDYTLRIQGNRKVFVEAKMVSIDIEKSVKSSFQIRRYGWNANLGISILTNFDKLIVYDCRYKPNATDEPAVARYTVFHLEDYLKKFDSIFDLLSFQSVSEGYLDQFFSVYQKDVTTFDEYFLRQIESWRGKLATNVIQNNNGLNEEDINFLTQRLLNRIVFLRICEDREIEKYETLKSIKTYEELKSLFVLSDRKYNSGLFDFIEDNFSLKINIHSELLIGVFNELYYPESPYDFSIVDPSILSQIYERYLGSKIVIINPSEINIVQEPEVAASSGVVPTPKVIVENIVRETLASILPGKSYADILCLKIADICCGSGTFLISVFDQLVETSTLLLSREQEIDDETIYLAAENVYKLTLKAKHSILTNTLFGVDINPYAVEVTKFSLLLKVLEGENAGSVDNFLAKYKLQVLPNLDDNIKTGNSLVDEKYYEYNPSILENDPLLFKVKPFGWKQEFPFLNKTRGFDAIVGNPPYVRIQNMVKYLGDEVKYYQSEISGYSVAQTETFDKYYLFIQYAVHLLNTTGVLGYIVPNKFLVVKGGSALRKFISENCFIQKIIHFGVVQVFPNRSTYTAVLILDKQNREHFKFKRIKKIATEFISGSIEYEAYRNEQFKAEPWIFVSKETNAVFRKLRSGRVVQLKTVAEITVGLQTSKDDVYIIKPHSDTDLTYKFFRDTKEYEVEKSICKPCIYKLQFSLFDTVNANAQMIFPYTISNGKAEAFTDEYFQSTYPLAWAYLNNFKDALQKRSISGKNPKWFQFGRTQSLTEFSNNSKLIWHVLSTKPTYIYDEADLQFTGGGNGPYYSLLSNSEYSPLYFLAILCHPLMEAMVRAGASEFRGAYYSHGKQFIEKLPIREIDFNNKNERILHDKIVKAVENLIQAKSKLTDSYGAKKAVLERKSDFLMEDLIKQVNALYEISKDDVDIVLEDEMFLTDLNDD